MEEDVNPRTGKPFSAQHYYTQALKSFEEKDHIKALTCLKQAVCLQPHCDEYRKCLGRLYLTALHDPLNALNQFFHVFRLSPHDSEYREVYDHLMQVLEGWPVPN
jgi:tetratricopeptide (TPR) repeat protein